MTTPARFHWYARVTGAGAHVPATAVSFCPTVAVPVIVGVGPVIAAAFVMTAVVALVFVAGE